MISYEKELLVARQASRAAGELQLSFLKSLPSVERKQDGSPVSEVDKSCELLIRDHITRAFPEDGFLGEESGSSIGTSGRSWIVDPLDGTRPYLRGIPTYSVLIALEDRSVPVVGVMHFPGLEETYWAARGGGAFFNGQPIRVSTTHDLTRAMGSALGFLERAETTEGARLFSLMRQWDYAYGFMDAYSYASVACGRIDASVNLLDKAWDCAAGACIVTEAGGSFSDVHGNRTVHNGSIVLSNGHLHAAILDWFSKGTI